VNDAWLALRDEIRTRTRNPHLDGTELINQGVGETDPRFPLTEYWSETDKNMHRGLVNFLRGIVFYIRHPEAHESISPIQDDQIGAMERLAIMSLVARHVAIAVPPTGIDAALSELHQARFPKKRAAYDDLMQRLRVRQHASFASKLLDQTVDAAKKGEDHYEGCVLAYRHVVEASPDKSLPATSASDCATLIADDSTLEIGVRLLTAAAARQPEPRHLHKVSDLLVEAGQQGRIPERGPEPEILLDLRRLFRVLPQDGRHEIIKSHIEAMDAHEDSRRSLYGFWTLVMIGHVLTEDERLRVGEAMATTLGSAEPESVLFKVWTDYPGRFPRPLRELIEVLLDRRAVELMQARAAALNALQQINEPAES
jgi:uncharacterized protein (TIGR02391 family)